MIFGGLLLLGSAVGTWGLAIAAPQPQLVNITYYGSGCPAESATGLTAHIGALDAKTNIAPLTFTLSNFTPTLGSFGSGLRMCDIIAFLSVDRGYKIVVNARGTQAQGYASLDNTTLLALRGTYQFADKAEIQSIGMLDVNGPVTGTLTKHLTPSDGDQGVASLCAGGELDIEFQSRSVKDLRSPMGVLAAGADNTTWTLNTDIEVLSCS